MILTDFKCNDCNHQWEVSKERLIDEYPDHPKCPECKSKNTYRVFSISGVSIAEGDNGMGVYHPSGISSKGRRIKIK